MFLWLCQIPIHNTIITFIFVKGSKIKKYRILHPPRHQRKDLRLITIHELSVTSMQHEALLVEYRTTANNKRGGTR